MVNTANSPKSNGQTTASELANDTPVWHRLSAEACTQRLEVIPEQGLDAAEVNKQRQTYGPNDLAVESAMTPPLAMTVARKRRTVKRTRYGRRRAPSKNNFASKVAAPSVVNSFSRIMLASAPMFSRSRPVSTYLNNLSSLSILDKSGPYLKGSYEPSSSNR